MSNFPFSGCCDDGPRLDLSKASFPNPLWYVYWDWDFTITALWIIAYPVYWIFVSQWEYRKGCLRRLCGGEYIACGLFAMTLLPISLYRDCRFMSTVRRQAAWWLLRQNPVLWTGHAFVVLGLVLVICSFRLLGLWATLLGDYFGIHEYKTDVRRRFPYTWFHHPMYCGSAFIFLGLALVMASQAGLLLALLAMVMYRVAVYFEHAHFCRYHHGVTLVTVQQQTGESLDDTEDPDDEGTQDDTEELETSDEKLTEGDSANPDIQNLGAAQDEDKRAAHTDTPPGDEKEDPKVKDQGVETEQTEGKKDREKTSKDA